MSLADAYLADQYAKEGLQDIQEQKQDVLELGETYAQESADMAQFKPYTVASSLGGSTTDVDPITGELTVNLTKSPEELALEKELLSGAGGMFTRAMADPQQAQADLYGQLRAIQQPEEQRQRLALEERMLSQGRLGLSSDAYGGATPEMLAQEQAIQENMLKANLGARKQSMLELGQFGDLGEQLLAGAYTPQSEATGLLGAGTNVAQLQDLGSREGAQLFNTMMQKTFDPFMALLESEYGLKKDRDKSYYDLLKDLI